MKEYGGSRERGRRTSGQCRERKGGRPGQSRGAARVERKDRKANSTICRTSCHPRKEARATISQARRERRGAGVDGVSLSWVLIASSSGQEVPIGRPNSNPSPWTRQRRETKERTLPGRLQETREIGRSSCLSLCRAGWTRVGNSVATKHAPDFAFDSLRAAERCTLG